MSLFIERYSSLDVPMWRLEILSSRFLFLLFPFILFLVFLFPAFIFLCCSILWIMKFVQEENLLYVVVQQVSPGSEIYSVFQWMNNVLPLHHQELNLVFCPPKEQMLYYSKCLLLLFCMFCKFLQFAKVFAIFLTFL